MRRQTLQAIAAHKARTAVLGVDPELVIVLELNRALNPNLIEPAQLNVLEIAEEKVLVAFASDPDLTEFLRRCEAYAAGPRPREDSEGERPAQYEELFDAVEHIRPLDTRDILSAELTSLLADLDDSSQHQALRLDVQCWCPEDATEARRRHDEVRRAVLNAGGSVLDASVRMAAGLSVLRVELTAGQVLEFAQIDRIRRIDVLPRPLLTYPQYWAAQPDSLPPVQSPAPDAPIIAIIDSGVRSAHPLLAPAVIGVEAVGPGLGGGGDEAGHGTLVASLALHGTLETALANRTMLRPAGRLLSIRVLNADNVFPDSRLWEEHLRDAIVLAADAGARIVNLSLGDPRRPYRPPRPTPLAAIIDGIARECDLVVVLSAGNYYPTRAYTVDAALSTEYPLRLLNDPEAGLLDPATAALALTVGALCSDHGQGIRPPRDCVDLVPLGRPNQPSPLTRCGPGAMGMVKPEVSAPGGSVAIDELNSRIVFNEPSLLLVGAGGERPERLLAGDAGTSFATPLVSHAALRVLSRYPFLTANGVRALVLASVETPDRVVEGLGEARDAAEQRRLTGYGRVSAERAEASDDHRAVLLAESEMVVDDVHLYTLPLPSTFFQTGGKRALTVALAYDPPVRPTRLDYLASRMMVRAFHGASLNTVKNAYVQQFDNTESLLPVAPTDQVDPVPSGLRPYEVKLQPTDTHRGRGAHQVGTFVFDRRLKEKKGAELVLAVRNTNRWDEPGARQRYALAVALERDNDRSPLYTELRAQLEALAEAEIEIG